MLRALRLRQVVAPILRATQVALMPLPLHMVRSAIYVPEQEHVKHVRGVAIIIIHTTSPKP